MTVRDHIRVGPALEVYLEQGRVWTFACALDWPGWARRGKGDEAAIEQLLAYAERYALVVRDDAPDFAVGEVHVIATVAGSSTTDFGAPDARGPWDDRAAEPERLARLLEACWTAFDRAVAAAPPELCKGPRGGGRDRNQIARHVQEAERSYGRKLGSAVPPRTPWPDQRAAFSAAVRTGAPGGSWPLAYAVRRFAWHVLDHAWEIEDKTPIR